MLRLSEVNFAYNSEPVLEGVTLSIREGDRVALIGPNGIGKTTLLKLAAGLLEPSSGSIEFVGRPMEGFSRRVLARFIALVPQQMNVPFEFTVRQIVEQGRTPYVSLLGSLRREDHLAIEEAMERTGVTRLKGRVYNRLSGGEQQRVRIAIALAQQPKLLLLDEPTQHLDFVRQDEVLELVSRLNSDGVTVVAAIHDLHAASMFFPWVVLLGQKRMIYQGSSTEVLRPEILSAGFGASPKLVASLSRLEVNSRPGPGGLR
jgi:iron complex transport system ATP-binding protein